MKFAITQIILLLLLFPFTASAAESLRLVTTLDPVEATEYIDSFKKETGIGVQWIRLSAGEALARLKSEAANPTQDIWFGAPAIEFIAAKKAGLLDPYTSAATKKIPEKWRDAEGFWTGAYFGAIAFISGKGITPPASWSDLLKPEYKNEIVLSYPYTAGTGFTILAGLISMMGEEKAFDYYIGLDKNVRRYTKSGGAPVIEVGLGEAGIGIVFDQDALRKGKSRGFPIQISYPSDGVPYEIGGVAIIKNGNIGLAARFVDWFVGPSAQGKMKKWYRVPILPGAELNPESRRPDSLGLAPMNFESAGSRREEIIKRWREKVEK